MDLFKLIAQLAGKHAVGTLVGATFTVVVASVAYNVYQDSKTGNIVGVEVAGDKKDVAKTDKDGNIRKEIKGLGEQPKNPDESKTPEALQKLEEEKRKKEAEDQGQKNIEEKLKEQKESDNSEILAEQQGQEQDQNGENFPGEEQDPDDLKDKGVDEGNNESDVEMEADENQKGLDSYKGDGVTDEQQEGEGDQEGEGGDKEEDGENKDGENKDGKGNKVENKEDENDENKDGEGGQKGEDENEENKDGKGNKVEGQENKNEENKENKNEENNEENKGDKDEEENEEENKENKNEENNEENKEGLEGKQDGETVEEENVNPNNNNNNDNVEGGETFTTKVGGFYNGSLGTVSGSRSNKSVAQWRDDLLEKFKYSNKVELSLSDIRNVSYIGRGYNDAIKEGVAWIMEQAAFGKNRVEYLKLDLGGLEEKDRLDAMRLGVEKIVFNENPMEKRCLTVDFLNNVNGDMSTVKAVWGSGSFLALEDGNEYVHYGLGEDAKGWINGVVCRGSEMSFSTRRLQQQQQQQRPSQDSRKYAQIAWKVLCKGKTTLVLDETTAEECAPEHFGLTELESGIQWAITAAADGGDGSTVQELDCTSLGSSSEVLNGISLGIKSAIGNQTLPDESFKIKVSFDSSALNREVSDQAPNYVSFEQGCIVISKVDAKEKCRRSLKEDFKNQEFAVGGNAIDMLGFEGVLNLAFNEPKLKELNLFLSKGELDEFAWALAAVARKEVKNESLKIKTNLVAGSEELKALKKNADALLWSGETKHFLSFDGTGRISLGAFLGNTYGWQNYEKAVLGFFCDSKNPENRNVSLEGIFGNVKILSKNASRKAYYEQVAPLKCLTIEWAACSGSQVETLDLTTKVATNGAMPTASMIALRIFDMCKRNKLFHGFTLMVPDAAEVWGKIEKRIQKGEISRDRIEFKDGKLVLKGTEDRTSTGGNIAAGAETREIDIGALEKRLGDWANRMEGDGTLGGVRLLFKGVPEGDAYPWIYTYAFNNYNIKHEREISDAAMKVELHRRWDDDEIIVQDDGTLYDNIIGSKLSSFQEGLLSEELTEGDEKNAALSRPDQFEIVSILKPSEEERKATGLKETDLVLGGVCYYNPALYAKDGMPGSRNYFAHPWIRDVRRCSENKDDSVRVRILGAEGIEAITSDFGEEFHTITTHRSPGFNGTEKARTGVANLSGNVFQFQIKDNLACAWFLTEWKGKRILINWVFIKDVDGEKWKEFEGKLGQEETILPCQFSANKADQSMDEVNAYLGLEVQKEIRKEIRKDQQYQQQQDQQYQQQQELPDQDLLEQRYGQEQDDDDNNKRKEGFTIGFAGEPDGLADFLKKIESSEIEFEVQAGTTIVIDRNKLSRKFADIPVRALGSVAKAVLKKTGKSRIMMVGFGEEDLKRAVARVITGADSSAPSKPWTLFVASGDEIVMTADEILKLGKCDDEWGEKDRKDKAPEYPDGTKSDFVRDYTQGSSKELKWFDFGDTESYGNQITGAGDEDQEGKYLEALKALRTSEFEKEKARKQKEKEEKEKKEKEEKEKKEKEEEEAQQQQQQEAGQDQKEAGQGQDGDENTINIIQMVAAKDDDDEDEEPVEFDTSVTVENFQKQFGGDGSILLNHMLEEENFRFDFQHVPMKYLPLAARKGYGIKREKGADDFSCYNKYDSWENRQREQALPFLVSEAGEVSVMDGPSFSPLSSVYTVVSSGSGDIYCLTSFVLVNDKEQKGYKFTAPGGNVQRNFQAKPGTVEEISFQDGDLEVNVNLVFVENTQELKDVLEKFPTLCSYDEFKERSVFRSAVACRDLYRGNCLNGERSDGNETEFFVKRSSDFISWVPYVLTGNIPERYCFTFKKFKRHDKVEFSEDLRKVVYEALVRCALEGPKFRVALPDGYQDEMQVYAHSYNVESPSLYKLVEVAGSDKDGYYFSKISNPLEKVYYDGGGRLVGHKEVLAWLEEKSKGWREGKIDEDLKRFKEYEKNFVFNEGLEPTQELVVALLDTFQHLTVRCETKPTWAHTKEFDDAIEEEPCNGEKGSKFRSRKEIEDLKQKLEKSVKEGDTVFEWNEHMEAFLGGDALISQVKSAKSKVKYIDLTGHDKEFMQAVLKGVISDNRNGNFIGLLANGHPKVEGALNIEKSGMTTCYGLPPSPSKETEIVNKVLDDGKFEIEHEEIGKGGGYSITEIVLALKNLCSEEKVSKDTYVLITYNQSNKENYRALFKEVLKKVNNSLPCWAKWKVQCTIDEKIRFSFTKNDDVLERKYDTPSAALLVGTGSLSRNFKSEDQELLAKDEELFKKVSSLLITSASDVGRQQEMLIPYGEKIGKGAEEELGRWCVALGAFAVVIEGLDEDKVSFYSPYCEDRDYGPYLDRGYYRREVSLDDAKRLFSQSMLAKAVILKSEQNANNGEWNWVVLSSEDRRAFIEGFPEESDMQSPGFVPSDNNFKSVPELDEGGLETGGFQENKDGQMCMLGSARNNLECIACMFNPKAMVERMIRQKKENDDNNAEPNLKVTYVLNCPWGGTFGEDFLKALQKVENVGGATDGRFWIKCNGVKDVAMAVMADTYDPKGETFVTAPLEDVSWLRFANEHEKDLQSEEVKDSQGKTWRKGDSWYLLRSVLADYYEAKRVDAYNKKQEAEKEAKKARQRELVEKFRYAFDKGGDVEVDNEMIAALKEANIIRSDSKDPLGDVIRVAAQKGSNIAELEVEFKTYNLYKGAILVLCKAAKGDGNANLVLIVDNIRDRDDVLNKDEKLRLKFEETLTQAEPEADDAKVWYLMQCYSGERETMGVKVNVNRSTDGVKTVWVEKLEKMSKDTLKAKERVIELQGPKENKKPEENKDEGILDNVINGNGTLKDALKNGWNLSDVFARVKSSNGGKVELSAGDLSEAVLENALSSWFEHNQEEPDWYFAKVDLNNQSVWKKYEALAKIVHDVSQENVFMYLDRQNGQVWFINKEEWKKRLEKTPELKVVNGDLEWTEELKSWWWNFASLDNLWIFTDALAELDGLQRVDFTKLYEGSGLNDGELEDFVKENKPLNCYRTEEGLEQLAKCSRVKFKLNGVSGDIMSAGTDVTDLFDIRDLGIIEGSSMFSMVPRDGIFAKRDGTMLWNACARSLLSGDFDKEGVEVFAKVVFSRGLGNINFKYAYEKHENWGINVIAVKDFWTILKNVFDQEEVHPEFCFICPDMNSGHWGDGSTENGFYSNGFEQFFGNLGWDLNPDYDQLVITIPEKGLGGPQTEELLKGTVIQLEDQIDKGLNLEINEEQNNPEVNVETPEGNGNHEPEDYFGNVLLEKNDNDNQNTNDNPVEITKISTHTGSVPVNQTSSAGNQNPFGNGDDLQMRMYSNPGMQMQLLYTNLSGSVQQLEQGYYLEGMFTYDSESNVVGLTGGSQSMFREISLDYFLNMLSSYVATKGINNPAIDLRFNTVDKWCGLNLIPFIEAIALKGGYKEWSFRFSSDVVRKFFPEPEIYTLRKSKLHKGVQYMLGTVKRSRGGDFPFCHKVTIK